MCVYGEVCFSLSFFFLVICITLNIVDWDQFFKDFCSVLLSMVYKYSWL